MSLQTKYFQSHGFGYIFSCSYVRFDISFGLDPECPDYKIPEDTWCFQIIDNTAEKSGLGWRGKHTNLINKQNGSFYFIAELIIDLELTPDGPIKDYCGTCTRCIDACPTDAILAPYEIDGSKCISYYTIELKESIPEDVKGKFDNWVFGCDACQDVCPWNRFSKPHQTVDFSPKESLFELSQHDFEDITEETFEKVFNGTPLRRTGYQGLIRNLNFVKQG